MMRNKFGGRDYSDILYLDRSDVELKVYCQCVLNRCALPTYMPNFPLSRTGKTAPFTNNVIGLIIWKYIHGIVWVQYTSLNIENNPKDVANFLSYEEYVKMNEPELWHMTTKGKPINYSGLNAFCTNLKHKHKEFGTWNAKSISKYGIYERYSNLLERLGFNFSDNMRKK